MELEPKYKLGEKVWFIAENGHVCYGTITMITPVSYTFTYTMKLVLDSVGEVVKNSVDENKILGDYDTSPTEILLNINKLD